MCVALARCVIVVVASIWGAFAVCCICCVALLRLSGVHLLGCICCVAFAVLHSAFAVLHSALPHPPPPHSPRRVSEYLHVCGRANVYSWVAERIWTHRWHSPWEKDDGDEDDDENEEEEEEEDNEEEDGEHCFKRFGRRHRGALFQQVWSGMLPRTCRLLPLP
eukprot:5405046-Pyramimonas_sp.AAC.1